MCKKSNEIRGNCAAKRGWDVTIRLESITCWPSEDEWYLQSIWTRIRSQSYFPLKKDALYKMVMKNGSRQYKNTIILALIVLETVSRLIDATKL